MLIDGTEVYDRAYKLINDVRQCLDERYSRWSVMEQFQWIYRIRSDGNSCFTSRQYSDTLDTMITFSMVISRSDACESHFRAEVEGATFHSSLVALKWELSRVARDH